MKKILALITMVLFVVAVAPAMAANGNGQGGPADIPAKIGEKMEAGNGKLVKAQFQEKKQEVAQWREKVKACKEEKTCNELKKGYYKNAAEYLLRFSEKVADAIERTEAALADAENGEDLSAVLEESKTKLEELNGKIEALGEEPAKEDVKEIAKDLKAILKDLRPNLQAGAGISVNSKLGQVVEKSEGLSAKLAEDIQVQAEAGVDTAEMEALLESFNTKVAEAKEQHALALEAFKSSRDETDSEAKLAKIAEAKEHQAQTKELLKEAREYLKELIQMLKVNSAEEVDDAEDNDSVEDSEEEETEVEEESENE